MTEEAEVQAGEEEIIVVRTLEASDYEQCRELHLSCFPERPLWTEEQFVSQLKTFPEGQIGVELEGRIVAAASSLVADVDIFSEKISWSSISGDGFLEHHDPEGDTLVSIGLMVCPEARGKKLARRLIDRRKQLVRDMNLQRVLSPVAAPKLGNGDAPRSADEFIVRIATRAIYEPALSMMLANNFVMKRLVPSFFKHANGETQDALLFEWSNIDYRQEHKRYLSSRPVRICVVQYQMRKISGFDDFARQCEYFTDVASGYKSDFVLFPELLTLQLLSFVESKQPAEAARFLAEFTPEYLELFTQLAINYNVNIIGGTHFVIEEGRLLNVAYLFKRNGEVHRQAKIHITPGEKRWWGVQPGDKIEVFDTDRGRIAIQICYDVEFPEMSRIVAEKGAQIIFVPFCTDERHGYLRVKHCALARCIENHVYVAIAGTVGNLPEVAAMDIQYAQSGILTPSDFGFARDCVAAECTPNVETVVIHDVDTETLRRHRVSGSTLNWRDRRTDLYELKEK